MAHTPLPPEQRKKQIRNQPIYLTAKRLEAWEPGQQERAQAALDDLTRTVALRLIAKLKNDQAGCAVSSAAGEVPAEQPGISIHQGEQHG